MVERRHIEIRRGSKGFQESAFGIADIWFRAAEKVGFLDIFNRRSKYMHRAIRDRAAGLISQNPKQEDVHKIKLL